jgi:hypothetical protein
MTNSIASLKVYSLGIDLANEIVNGIFNDFVIRIINVISNNLTNGIPKDEYIIIYNGKANSLNSISILRPKFKGLVIDIL